MMGNRSQTIAALALVAFTWSASSLAAGGYPVKPPANEGEKSRLGYYQGGRYQTYPVTLRKVVANLVELGWIDEALSIPEDLDTAEAVWGYLAANARSAHIEFLADAFWTADWDAERREKVKEDAIARLAKREDIDLVLAMGTWAGKDLANDRHATPTLVFDASDPVGAKIIKSGTDSGFNHIHARIDPTRFRRQIGLFHELIGFSKLGVCYIDNDEGRSYAALDDVRAMAKDRRFDVVEGTIPSGTSKAVALEDTVACHRELAEKIDAMYITEQAGIQLEKMDELLAPLEKHKVPTFSQLGARYVEKGALISIARSSNDSVARFHAETIARVLNGARPRDLDQVFEVPPMIAINLKRAVRIGVDFPVPVLVTVDELY